MMDNCVKKGLVLTILLLFISVSFQPIIAEKTKSVGKETDYRNVDFEEAKEYLFQTIIDISNNPDVKELIKQNNHKIFTSDYNYKSVFSKLFLKKPRLLKSILFTRSKMTYEYLETTYKRGLEIVDILGEEESSKMAESVKISNPELFNELKNIILNDEELSNRTSVLEEMNNNLKSNLGFWEFPVICSILFIIFLPVAIGWGLFTSLILKWNDYGKPLFLFLLLMMIPLIPIFYLIELIIIIPYYLFGCDF